MQQHAWKSEDDYKEPVLFYLYTGCEIKFKSLPCIVREQVPLPTEPSLQS